MAASSRSSTAIDPAVCSRSNTFSSSATRSGFSNTASTFSPRLWPSVARGGQHAGIEPAHQHQQAAVLALGKQPQLLHPVGVAELQVEQYDLRRVAGQMFGEGGGIGDRGRFHAGHARDPHHEAADRGVVIEYQDTELMADRRSMTCQGDGSNRTSMVSTPPPHVSSSAAKHPQRYPPICVARGAVARNDTSGRRITPAPPDRPGCRCTSRPPPRRSGALADGGQRPHPTLRAPVVQDRHGGTACSASGTGSPAWPGPRRVRRGTRRSAAPSTPAARSVARRARFTPSRLPGITTSENSRSGAAQRFSIARAASACSASSTW